MRQFLYFAFKIKDGLFIGDINAPSVRIRKIYFFNKEFKKYFL